MTLKRMVLRPLSCALTGALFFANAAVAGKPVAAPPDPKLVYANKSDSIEVSNVDGSWSTVLKQGCYNSPTTCYHTRPTWQPSADRPGSSPVYRIVYESPICVLNQIDLKVTANGVQVTGDHLITGLSLAYACAPNYSPDGGTLLFGGGASDPSSIYTMTDLGIGPAASSLATIYTASQGLSVTFATFSNDGKKIAFAESQNSSPYATTIKLLGQNATGGWSSDATTLLSGFGGRFLEWSPKDDRLAFDDGAGSVYTVNTLTREVRKITKGNQPTWSADGRYLFVADGTAINRIDVSSGASTSIVRGANHPKYRRCLSAATALCP